MTPRQNSRIGAALLASLHVVACAQPKGSTPPAPAPIVAQAGFVEAQARTVTLHGRSVSIDATARLFYNLRPADQSPEDAPIVVLFNGFADDIVRAYGTGPTTVAMGGDVVDNPASLTRFANLLYVEPRQAGVPYSPLEPGKETRETSLDWRTLEYQAIAFADNLRDVPAFLTQGDRDLVVPTLALAPALGAALGSGRLDTQAAARLGIRYSDGERFVDIFEYPDAGHMVSMVEGAQLTADLGRWLPSTR